MEKTSPAASTGKGQYFIVEGFHLFVNGKIINRFCGIKDRR